MAGSSVQCEGKTMNMTQPADWRPGDDVIVPTAGSCGVAKERMESKDGMHYYDWFFCTKSSIRKKGSKQS